MKLAKKFLPILILSVLLIGCSNSSNPISAPNVDTDSDTLDSGISNQNSDLHNLSNPGVFGAWKVHIDPEELTAEIIHARNAAAIGDIFDSDLSQFLTVSPCSDCLRITGVYLDEYGDLRLKIKLKHPFDNLATRPDLHGFDIRAIFIHEPLHLYDYPDIVITPPGSSPVPAELIRWQYGSLLNADGYTSHYDWLTTDPRYFPGGEEVSGNLNPYLRFFNDYSTDPFDPHAPSGHNVMPVGAGFSTRTAVFHELVLYAGLDFYIVADVAYGQSAVLANRTNPQYYLPAFNRTEPWRVEYWLENNNLVWQDPTSTADIVVQVFDWQHGYNADPNYPDPANPIGIPESSDVLRLELSVPDLQNDPVVVTTPELGSGSPQDPLQYRLTVTNSNLTGNLAWGLLAVRDELYGQAYPTGRMPVPESPSGFPYSTLDILDYSLYYRILIPQHNLNGWYDAGYADIDGEVYLPFVEPYAQIYLPDPPSTTLHPRFYSDLGHSNYLYQWDYDYDEITFDIDATGLPSDKIEFNKAGRNNIGLRVRTNSKPPREYTYTIPVYAEGIAYDIPAYPTSPQISKSSSQGNNAIAATEDHVYYVTTREESSQRDIWLSRTSRPGSTSSTSVTSSSRASHTPSMCIIEEGPNAGVYITYCEYDSAGPETFIYFTKCDLNLGGLTVPKRISTTTSDEYSPNIIHFRDKLFIYFTKSGPLFSYIYGAHSDDYGDSWIDDGRIVDAGIGLGIQDNSSVTQDDDLYVYLVWYDLISFSEPYSDIYFAWSNDGSAFFGIDRISTVPNNYRESYPSVDFYFNQIAVAYLARESSSDNTQTYLTCINQYDLDAYSSYPVETLYDSQHTHTEPSVTICGNGVYIVSYGAFHLTDNSLNAVVVELKDTIWAGRLDETVIYNEYIGDATDQYLGNSIAPCTATWKTNSYAADNFLVYTNLTDGYVQSPINPKKVFGDVYCMYFCSDAATQIYY